MYIMKIKAILVGIKAYLFKYGLINENTYLYIHSNQEIKLINTQKIYTVADDNYQYRIESKSVNSTRVKTGSGAVIEVQKQYNQTPKALKSTLEIRCGDLGKSGPGPKAKANARKNFNKGTGSSIIPGASGYTPQHVYRIYQKIGRLPAPQSKIEAIVQNSNEGAPHRIAPSVSPNRQSRIKSQPLKIKSQHQKKDVIITKKDVKKWITPEQRKQTSNQKINEQRVEEKFVDTVKNPNEVLDGIHIHREQKNCKVYIKDIETSDGTQEKLALIADTKTGRSYLGSTLTEQEYSNLKTTGEIDLSDLRRDPQTLVMNQKSIQEAEALSRAKDQGCLTEITDIRRPHNVSESLTDFVGKDSMGSKIKIDFKAINASGHRTLDRQTQDINQNIKDLFESADDSTKLQIICDISELPSFLKNTVIKNITHGLASEQLDNISFLWD